MKIKNFKFSMTLPLVFILIGVFLGYSIFNKDKSLPNKWTLTDNTNINNPKYSSTESLVNEIRSVNKIIPLEMELSEEIIINDSWGDLRIFEKVKHINFFAKCSYSIDLSSLSTECVKNTNNNISITIPKPKVESISIIPNKTLYNQTEVGLFRFGDIEISSESYGLIYNDVIDAFYSKMMSEELYNQSLDASTNTIKKIISDLIGDNITIDVIFE